MLHTAFAAIARLSLDKSRLWCTCLLKPTAYGRGKIEARNQCALVRQFRVPSQGPGSKPRALSMMAWSLHRNHLSALRQAAWEPMQVIIGLLPAEALQDLPWCAASGAYPPLLCSHLGK